MHSRNLIASLHAPEFLLKYKSNFQEASSYIKNYAVLVPVGRV
jgi:hypothetical protein